MRVEHRRRLLAEAAMRVMERDGVRAATTRAVTTEAGMPHGAFHYCFRSKNELFQEVFQSDAEAAFTAALDVLGAGTDLHACLERALAAFWAATVADRDAQVVLVDLSSLAFREPALEELRKWQVEVYTSRLGEELAALADRTGSRWRVEPRVLGGLLYSALTGITESWLALGEAADPQAQIDLLTNAVAQQADTTA